MNITFPIYVALLFFPGGIFLLGSGLIFEYIDRKLVARFQNRVGPRWFQPLADFVKLLAKEEIIPTGVNKALFIILPIIALTAALTAALYTPLFGFKPVYSFNGDLMVTLYLLSMMTLCIGLAGANTEDRFSLVGATRALDPVVLLRSPLPAGAAGTSHCIGNLEYRHDQCRRYGQYLVHHPPADRFCRGSHWFDGKA